MLSLRKLLFLTLVSSSPLLASELERVTPAEVQQIKEITDIALTGLKAHYPESSKALVLRDAHAKAHGCAKAVFTVREDIPISLRIGTFSTPGKKYKAIVRFSNGAFKPGPDTGMDGRGMAIKIIDSDPERSLSDRSDDIHDILLINYPVFFSPNVEDYASFAEAGALTGDTEGLKKYFFPGLNPFSWRLRQAYIAYEIASQKIDSPLAAQYYSMVPYGFGDGRAVKYSAKPCNSSFKSSKSNGGGENFLREALANELSNNDACFEILVQEKTSEEDVEDATQLWKEATSPFLLVGKLDIPAQKIKDTKRDDLCEAMSFTPWNAPKDQLPLGGINRLRRVVYDEISSYRSQRNKVVVESGSILWGKF